MAYLPTLTARGMWGSTEPTKAISSTAISGEQEESTATTSVSRFSEGEEREKKVITRVLGYRVCTT